VRWQEMAAEIAADSAASFSDPRIAICVPPCRFHPSLPVVPLAGATAVANSARPWRAGHSHRQVITLLLGRCKS
jgi:hypothetical protein